MLAIQRYCFRSSSICLILQTYGFDYNTYPNPGRLHVGCLRLSTIQHTVDEQVIKDNPSAILCAQFAIYRPDRIHQEFKRLVEVLLFRVLNDRSSRTRASHQHRLSSFLDLQTTTRKVAADETEEQD